MHFFSKWKKSFCKHTKDKLGLLQASQMFFSNAQKVAFELYPFKIAYE